MLYATFSAKRQQALNRINIVSFIEIIDWSRPFHTFINTCRKHKAIAACQVFLQLFICHFQIVSVFDLHLRRKNCTGRERW